MTLQRDSPDGRDVYDDLLRESRGLRREHANAREAWLANLVLDHKVERLFELEILLKAFACYASPRNHPGPLRKVPVAAQDFREHTALVRDGLSRVVRACRALLVDRERAFVFQRYLDTVIPDDRARGRQVSEPSAQETPERSLFVLRFGMSNLLEVATGLTRLPRVPFRLFYSLLALAQREVSKNTYFNPIHAFEFRPEFDRITGAPMLAVIRAVSGEPVRRLVALTVLSMFRMLRYIAAAERVLQEPTDGSKRSVAVVYLVLSVLRSDARALANDLRRQASGLLADAFASELHQLPAHRMREDYESLVRRGNSLHELKATLAGLAENLRIEMRRAFEHDFLPVSPLPSPEEVRTALHRVASNLRPALQSAVLAIGRSLGVSLDAKAVFEEHGAGLLAERHRREVWMFAQILRAFALKARAVGARAQASWARPPPLRFVAEFTAYFRAMGYPMLRTADYSRADALIAATIRLRDAEVIDSVRLGAAIDEAEQFRAFLTEHFDALGRSGHLAGIPFDRRAAAESLTHYLAD